MKTITITTIVSQVSGQVSGGIDEEAIVVSLKEGTYNVLDEVATTIWGLLTQPISVGDLCKALMEEYEVDQQTCESQTISFLQELQEKEVIEVSS